MFKKFMYKTRLNEICSVSICYLFESKIIPEVICDSLWGFVVVVKRSIKLYKRKFDPKMSIL